MDLLALAQYFCLHSRQADAKTFAAECASPCFSTNFTDPKTRICSYDEFRKLNIKWQLKLGKVGDHPFSFLQVPATIYSALGNPSNESSSCSAFRLLPLHGVCPSLGSSAEIWY